MNGTRLTLGALLLSIGVIGCSDSGATVHGLSFEPKDAIYVMTEETNNERNIELLVSNMENLCESLKNGESFAGSTNLSIFSRWTGSAHFEYRKYDRDCALEARSDGRQGWIAVDDSAVGRVDAEFSFINDGRHVSGSLTAGYCDLGGMTVSCLH